MPGAPSGLKPLSVALLGTGNVAWSLAPAIARLPGYRLTHVWGRHPGHAAELAALAPGAVAVESVSCIPAATTDVYIVSLTDDAVAGAAASGSAWYAALDVPERRHAAFLHTSGGLPTGQLAPLGAVHGVVYPLQTFTRGRSLDFSGIPVYYDGPGPAAEALARALSPRARHADQAMRLRLHVAGVLACNFTNYLLGLAGGLVPLDDLAPLVTETLGKAFGYPGPEQGQTGPARRGDATVLRRHLESLPPGETRSVYEFLTSMILKHYGHELH